MTLNVLDKILKVEVNVGIKEERQLLNVHNSSKLANKIFKNHQTNMMAQKQENISRF